MRKNFYCIHTLTIIAILSLTLGMLTLNGYAEAGYIYEPDFHWPLGLRGFGNTITYHINNLGTPDIPGTTAEFEAIRQAFQTWENDQASFIDFVYGGTTDEPPDNQPGHGQNVVGWAYLGAEAPVAQTTPIHDQYDNIVGCDMILNDYYLWDTEGSPDAFDVKNVVTHEVGHWLWLGDIYTNEDNDQTMYGYVDEGEIKKSTLAWGDRAGIRYLYPNRYQVDTNDLHSINQGGDIALGQINGINGLDMVVGWIDDLSGDNSIEYCFGWDISSSTGEPVDWGSTHTMPGWEGAFSGGLGLALTNLDATSNLDLVISWTDYPSGDNTIYYKIAYNLDSSGTESSWSSLKTVPHNDIGEHTEGSGVTLKNIDSDSKPEMIVSWADNPIFGNTIYYKIGMNIDANGDAASWSTKKTKPSGVGDATSGVGVVLSDIGGSEKQDLVIFWIDNPFGANHGHYQIGWDISSSGNPSSWSDSRLIPGDWHWMGDDTHGCGVASGQVGLTSRNELVFMWIDNAGGANNAHYRVLWEKVQNRPPDRASQPSGPTSGLVPFTTYEYTTSANDPDGDPIRYIFDWDDGATTTTDWYQSGDIASASHEWDHTGTYQITAMAQDANNAEGIWSESLEITVTGVVLDIEPPIHGTTDPPPDTYVYATPRYVGVTAIPDDHYQLAYWLYDGSNIGSNNPCTVFVSEGNHVLQAIFELEQILYRIAASPPTGGTTVPPPGDYYDSYGSYIEVTADPFVHYEFDCWWLDGSPVSEDLTYWFTLDDTHWLQANFDFTGTHDVAVTNVVSDKTIVGQTYPTNVSVTVENQGDIAEQIQVTLYANSTTVETKQVTLSIEESRTLTYVWDTTGFPYGNYTLSAEAQIIIYSDDDPTDNSMTDGSILVTIAGDIDGDHEVNIFDIVIMAGAYGTIKGQPGYIPNCDLDNDGDIDIFDIIIAQGNYGQSW